MTGEHLFDYIESVDRHLHGHIDTVSGELVESITTERLRDVILSGDLLNTGTLLEGLIDQVSGDLSQSIIDEHLRDVVLSGDLVQTGEHLHEHIDNLSGQTFASFSFFIRRFAETGDFLYNFIGNVSGDLTTFIDQDQAGKTRCNWSVPIQPH